jgi:hypothetical protein
LQASRWLQGRTSPGVRLKQTRREHLCEDRELVQSHARTVSGDECTKFMGECERYNMDESSRYIFRRQSPSSCVSHTLVGIAKF